MKKILKAYWPVFALLAIFLLGADLSSASIDDLGIIGSGLGMKYAIIAVSNINKPELSERRGGQTRDRIWILLRENADTDNAPLIDEDAQTMADIPLEAGGYWFYVDAQKASVIPKFASEGDLGLQVTNTVDVILDGLTAETRAFLQKNAGQDMFIVWENCVTGKRYIAGTKCTGMLMTIAEGGWLAEMTGATLLFTSTCPEIPAEYIGTVPTLSPITVAADAVEIAYFSSNPVYQLTTGSVASVNITTVTGLVAANHGQVIKILGSGGAFPSTIDADDDFVLKDGTTWTAEAGAELVVQVFKSGAATYSFVEIRRT